MKENILINKYVTLRQFDIGRLTADDSELDLNFYNDGDALLKIKTIEETENGAGYYVEFYPILGNHTKFLKHSYVYKPNGLCCTAFSYRLVQKWIKRHLNEEYPESMINKDI